MEAFSGLYPPAIWHYFGEICNIPRLSGHEDRIIQYLLEFGRRKQLETLKDPSGNILIRKSASRGCKNLRTLVLQSHMDMVGEKDRDSAHDFLKDAIQPVRNGAWITARGTTLGADDGIGMAAQLAILADNSIEHGPLECLFTVDEESGMTGAKSLEPGFIKGEILVNLDSEDWGELFIGCAGGMDTLADFQFRLQPLPEHSIACRICVSGLRGGHSGDEIHKSPGNAIKLLSRILLNTGEEHGLHLSRLEGGNLRNAIPREACAEFIMPEGNLKGFSSSLNRLENRIRKELKDFEPGFKLNLDRISLPENVLMNNLHVRFLQALENCPHGVVRWSDTIDDLVETSTNLASVRFSTPETARVITSQRSSVESAKKDIAEKVAACFKKGGARTMHSNAYPGWTPNMDSGILKTASACYRELFGDEPLVKAIHAGLECGLILEKYPGLDMVSLGPNIRGAHTPGERLDIESTEKFWKLLTLVLRRIPVEASRI